MKRCGGPCGLEKPESEFSPKGRGILNRVCKTCRAAGEKAKRHARPERSTLTLMIQRCHNPKNPKYKHYGARGITVCAEWRAECGFDGFFAHVGPKPTPKHSIERIKNDRGYEPGNVRWATQSEQMSNTRRTRLITANGRTQTLAEWERETGIQDLAYRLEKGDTPEEAVARPARPVERLITFDGVTLNQTEWSARLGGKSTLVVDRLDRGWTEHEAVSIPVGGRRRGRAA